MSIMYNFLLEENAKLRKQLDELLLFARVTQVATSHLLQDGDIIGDGIYSVKDLKTLSEELLEKFSKNEV